MRPDEVLNLATGAGLLVGLVFTLVGFLLIVGTGSLLALPVSLSGVLFLVVSGVVIPGLRAIEVRTSARA